MLTGDVFVEAYMRHCVLYSCRASCGMEDLGAAAGVLARSNMGTSSSSRPTQRHKAPLIYRSESDANSRRCHFSPRLVMGLACFQLAHRFMENTHIALHRRFGRTHFHSTWRCMSLSITRTHSQILITIMHGRLFDRKSQFSGDGFLVDLNTPPKQCLWVYIVNHIQTRCAVLKMGCE